MARKSEFSEAQIIGAIKECEAGGQRRLPGFASAASHYCSSSSSWTHSRRRNAPISHLRGLPPPSRRTFSAVVIFGRDPACGVMLT
jgi:hypothetical protein